MSSSERRLSGLHTEMFVVSVQNEFYIKVFPSSGETDERTLWIGADPQRHEGQPHWEADG